MLARSSPCLSVADTTLGKIYLCAISLVQGTYSSIGQPSFTSTVHYICYFSEHFCTLIKLENGRWPIKFSVTESITARLVDSYTIMFPEKASALTLVCCDDEVKVQAPATLTGGPRVMALSSSRPHRQSCWWYEVSRLHIGQHSYTIMFQEASDLTLVCCDDEVKVQASKAAAEKIDSKDAKSEDGGVARTYAATSRTTCTRVYFTARVMSYCQSIVSSLNIHSLTHVY